MKFPGHETAEFDEETGLPVGWERKRFDMLLFLQRGFDLPTRSRENGDIPIYASTGIVDYHNEYKVIGPGIITGRSGTIGQVQYSSRNFWPLNTSLWIKKYYNCGPIFALHFLRYINLERFAGGSAVPSLDRRVVHAQQIKIPSTNLIKAFEDNCKPLFELIDNLLNQNQLLKEARDVLLSRLMMGLVAVEELLDEDGNYNIDEVVLGRVAEEEKEYKTDK